LRDLAFTEKGKLKQLRQREIHLPIHQHLSMGDKRDRIVKNYQVVESIHPVALARTFDKHIYELLETINILYMRFLRESQQTNWGLLTRLNGAPDRVISQLREKFKAETLRDDELEEDQLSEKNVMEDQARINKEKVYKKCSKCLNSIEDRGIN
jgi:hypothetical protein